MAWHPAGTKTYIKYTKDLRNRGNIIKWGKKLRLS